MCVSFDCRRPLDQVVDHLQRKLVPVVSHCDARFMADLTGRESEMSFESLPSLLVLVVEHRARLT